MLGAFQKFTLSILVFALMLILGSCSDKDQVNGPSVPKYLRGDINNNGIAYEVADAVLFTNYFIYGLGVFTIDQEIQIAATDVNKDGLTLSVADLTYMIRIVLGDAQPIFTLNPVDAFYKINVNSIIEIDMEIGAAALQLQGNVEPTLLADNMDIEYAFDAANNVTRVLVYNSTEKGQTFSGDFLNMNGSKLVSIEMATYEGAKVVATETEGPPEHYLMQNIPNPFSDTTVIYFALPKWSEVRFEITNFSGELVFESTEQYSAGLISLIWRAVDKYGRALPVGTYYCTVIFEESKSTIEMQKVL